LIVDAAFSAEDEVGVSDARGEIERIGDERCTRHRPAAEAQQTCAKPTCSTGARLRGDVRVVELFEHLLEEIGEMRARALLRHEHTRAERAQKRSRGVGETDQLNVA
jgi:hypothetical protein